MIPIKFDTNVSPLPSSHARSFGVAEALLNSPETPVGYTCLQVTGSDAVTFLQGQMTSDVAALTTGQCQTSALCEPKGRVIAQMDIARFDDETFALMLAQRLAVAVSTTLSKYIMRSKVSIKPWPDHALISLVKTDQPLAQGQCVLSPNNTLLCRPTWLPQNDPDWVLTNGFIELTDYAVEAGMETRDLTWAHAHVLFGLAPPVTATDLQHIPQMLNLDVLQGISMTKGCYTGQEIIARVHHRGSVKRRLRRFLTNADSHIEPGNPVENSAGGNAGVVVEVVRDDHNQLGVLAVVKESDYSPEKTLKCNGLPLTHWPLPYPV